MPPPDPTRSPRPLRPSQRPALIGPPHLHTGTDLLTDTQKTQLEQLFVDDENVAVEVAWEAYQAMVTAHRDPDPARGRDLMKEPITSLTKHIARSLLETGGFRPAYTVDCEESLVSRGCLVQTDLSEEWCV